MPKCIFGLVVILASSAFLSAQQPAREREPIFQGRLLSDWVKMLGDKDPAVRLAGANALVEMREMAKPVAPQLVDYLRSEDAYTRQLAAFALGQIQADPKIAVPALFGAIQDKDAEVRKYASHALLYQGPVVRESVSQLGELIKNHADPEVRRMAVYVLGNIKQPKRRSLKDPPPPLRKAEVAIMADALKDKERSIRMLVVNTLGDYAPEGDDVAPILVAALSDPDKDVRAAVPLALEKLRAQAKVTVPGLIKALKDPDPTVRRNAGRALAVLQSEARDHLSEFKEILKSGDPHARIMAVYVLGQIKPPLPKPRDPSELNKPMPPREKRTEEVAILVEALKDSDANVRMAAADALKNYKYEGKEAMAGLVPLLKDSDKNVRLKAFEVVQFFPEEAKQSVPILIEALKDKDTDVRGRASVALVVLGFETKKHLADLRGILKEDPVHPRQLVVFILGNMSDFDKEVLDVLYDALKDKEDVVRRKAEEIIKARESIERKINLPKEPDTKTNPLGKPPVAPIK